MFNVKNLLYYILITIFSCGSIFGFICTNQLFYPFIDNFIEASLSSQITYIIFYIISIIYYSSLYGLLALLVFPVTVIDFIYKLIV